MELIGRQRELDLIASVLEDARSSRARALAFMGEPGIGKTALLDWAVAAAGGFTVVRVAGLAAEQDYPYAGLMAVVRPLRQSMASLPATQSAAIEAVLAADAGSTERFAVAAGTLGLLGAAAESSPLLLLVDDLQWLDEPTRDALTFALRRLSADAVAAVMASRPGGLGDIARAFDDVIEVAALDADAASSLLTADDAVSPDPLVRAALLAAAHGNPLALLELPRRLTPGQRAGSEPLPPSLAAGELVAEAFASSARTLPEPSRVALAVAALVEEDAVQLLEAALSELGVTVTDLEAAEAEALLRLEPGRVVFRHPLVRSAALHAAGDAACRRAHGALARALPPGEARALHLGAAAVGADANAAAELVRVAAEVPAVTAAALLTRAAELSGDRDERARTFAAAADKAFLAGRLGQSRTLAERVLGLSPPEAVRGAALVTLGRVARFTRPPTEACELLLDGADALAASDRPAALAAVGEAFITSLVTADRIATGDLANRFLELHHSDAASERANALVVEGIALVMSGRGEEGEARLRAALEPGVAGAVDADTRERGLLVAAALWLDDHHRALVEAMSALNQARSGGRLWALPSLLQFAGFAEARLGRFDAAYALLSEAAEMAEEFGQLVSWCDCANTLAGLEARLGLHDRCRDHAEQAIDLAAELSLDWFATHAALHLALSELGQGRAEEAAIRLEGIRADNIGRGVTDPAEYGYEDLIEAYYRLGQLELAAERLAELETLIDKVPRPMQRALALRCAALLATGPEADALFERSLGLHTAEMPFEMARTHLLWGERLRRDGERRRAREQLQRALDEFEALGAGAWAERCRRELVASGARLRRRDAATRDELTPQELQVALQVAAGLSNREIAQTLFLSPKTVEFHLTRIYRKLGLHARAELIERFVHEATPEQPLQA